MGAYDRFKNLDAVMGVRNWIKEGNHVLQVRRTEMSKSKNPQKKGIEKAVVEFKTIKSDTQKVGQICSLVEMESNQGYTGNVLMVTAGILGMDHEKMVEDPDFDAIFDAAWGTEQIFTGMLVRCGAQQVKTSKGGDYTAKTWEPVPAAEYPEFGLIAPDGAYVPSEGEDAAA